MEDVISRAACTYDPGREDTKRTERASYSYDIPFGVSSSISMSSAEGTAADIAAPADTAWPFPFCGRMSLYVPLVSPSRTAHHSTRRTT